MSMADARIKNELDLPFTMCYILPRSYQMLGVPSPCSTGIPGPFPASSTALLAVSTHGRDGRVTGR